MKRTVGILSMDLKRAFGSSGFLLAILGVWLIYYAGAGSEIEYAPDVLLLFKYSTQASGFNKIIILCCVLPYTISYCIDWNSKYMRPVVIRVGSFRYALSKIIACGLSSAMAVVVGIILFIVPFAIHIPLVSPVAGNFEAFATGTLGGELLLDGQYVSYFVVYIYLAALAGAFWAIVGLCASAFMPNKFVALFLPFIGLYVLNFITVEFPIWLQLNEVTNGDVIIGGTTFSLIYATLLVGVLLAGVGLLFVKTTARRLSNE
ncbi:hypothetical protein PAECIP111893_03970 [Paenibacillus plantiphilus]|uniref:ABC-2 family transporter protein n=1 Tax=Paenibacillus plantiphilus TaxID=2905650 RepID=A0ABM9CKB5_9BACL|nr:hypothetical protein [Paenibacillus plantiphilus]CAH1215439.1 hypothetical protein PAECIP111893_03970 [Paenibacillus plantiphilus]